MTELDLEIQTLRREYNKLHDEVESLRLLRQLDRADIVQLRRVAQALEEEIETKDEMIRVLKDKTKILQDALNLWTQGATGNV